MVSAILNLYVTLMLPIKFNSAQSNLRRRCRLKHFMAAMVAIWISERKDFSNSESLCHSAASNQVLAQSNFRFGRCYLKNFKG